MEWSILTATPIELIAEDRERGPHQVPVVLLFLYSFLHIHRTRKEEGKFFDHSLQIEISVYRV